MTETALVRINATYPMFGDLTPEDWANVVFTAAKEEGKIQDWAFLSSREGAWGIEHVTFTVDTDLKIRPAECKAEVSAMVTDQILEAAELLQGIVQDSDVEINTIVPVPTEEAQ